MKILTFRKILKNLENPWFSLIFSQTWWNVWYCARLPNTWRGVRWEYDALRVSGNRFQTRTHALDSPESNTNRFGDFYFSTKIMIFRKFLKILENPWFRLILATQGGLLLLRFEIEQAARATSMGRGSGAWCPNTCPRMSPVSSECPRVFTETYTGRLFMESCDFADL